MMRRLLAFITACVVSLPALRAQQACPPNVDFEQGSLTSWSFYVGSNTNGTVGTLTSTAPIPSRHALTSGAGTDPYGSFPIVAPGGGSYSLKLGNSNTGAEMDQARYTFVVPAGTSNFSLIYRYAVVFEDPGHTLAQQPFFKVRAYDATTGAIINCSNYNYISQASLPGFQSNGSVRYRPWSTGSINLSGQAGNTIVIEFTAADCSLGGHFGYGYVDMTCGLFSIMNTNCNGAPTTPLSAPAGFQTYSWYDASYSTLIATGQNITINTPAASTTYHVILTPYAGYGCTDTLTTQIISSALTVNAGPDTALCNSPSVQLNAAVAGTAAPFTYSWAPSAGLSCTGCINPVATPTVQTSYVLTVTDASGCVKADTINVKSGVALAVTSQNIPCYNAANGAATAVASQGTAPYSYAWTTSPTQSTAGISNLAPGSYTVTATDASGCTKSQSVAITQPLAALGATASHTNAICGNANATATAAVTGGTAPYTYLWNTSPAQTGATASGLTAGTYTVTVTDSKGCTTTAATTVTQPSPLQLGLAITNVACNGGSTGSAIPNVSGGVAPYAWQWNNNPALTSPTMTNAQAGSYSVKVTDNNGCIQQMPFSITQPAAISGTMGVTQITCNGAANGALTFSPAGGVLPYAYSWNNNASQNTNSTTGLNPGSYTVTLTDSNGCTYNATAVITQPAPATASVSVTNATCWGTANGAAAVLTGSTYGTVSHHWSTYPAQYTPTATSLASGVYADTISYGQGCKLIAYATVTQPVQIQVALTLRQQSCPGFANSRAIAVATAGVTPYTYNWNSGPAQTGDTLRNVTGGIYSVLVTDANGCTRSATLTIPDLPKPDVTTGPDAKFCDGQYTNLTAAGADTYVWSPNYGLSCLYCNNPLASPATPTVYTIIGTNQSGCKDTATVTVTPVHRVPVGTGGERSICKGDTAQLGAFGGLQYTWSPAGTLDNAATQHPVATPETTTTYSVAIKENECFTETVHQTVTVLPYPTIRVSEDMKGLSGAVVTLNSTVTGATGITWSPADGLSCTACPTPEATLGASGITYVAEATNSLGCKARDSVRIVVTCNGDVIYLANTFTPNADGQNDWFYPQGVGAVSIKHFVVYDRWGEKVFTADNISSNNPETGWDGTFRGVPLKPDVYMYMVETTCSDGTPVILKGDISLMR